MNIVEKKGRVIWITGLSGSGKTTLAKELQKRLPGSIMLDGDDLRHVMDAVDHGFDVDSRLKLAKSYARFAGLLARQGFTVLVATISLFHDVHAWNREKLPGYLEIFLDVPEQTRRKRDPKGLYAANTPDMAGEMVIPEFPKNPHLRLDDGMKLETSVEIILNMIRRNDLQHRWSYGT